ncbi:N-6 DNA Methylase [Mucilaginibacter pineti]|uniref:N-6 DNA Methylase n=1 Tax=Mucilaginibacter pineti TaxID=1391627 RepID=A0A1G7B350_9SPHI|nr:N-6 DNA methylase [Mucilaginibacter pineti]SDE21277.1 N-6 DNA Methylase [Mucilaginibacter pineti]
MTDITKLVSLFERYAHDNDYSSALGGLLDFFLLPFRLHGTPEARSSALAAFSGNPRREAMLAVLSEAGERAEDFGDPLGALFERLVSKGRKGQFFTPDPVADLMAAIAMGDAAKGGTVLDPACGSGRMLLAAARVNRHARLYGADVDPLCCNIALANMIMNSLTGEIAHMDSLSNEFYAGYRTGTALRNGYHHPYYVEFSDPSESRIWQRSRMPSENGPSFSTGKGGSGGTQGTLF